MYTRYLFRFGFLCLLLLCQNIPAQNAPYKSTEDLKAFEKASLFLFSTLKENFGGEDADNISELMGILSEAPYEMGGEFKLQINVDWFKGLNAELIPLYDMVYPLHVYSVNPNAESEFIHANTITNPSRDTLRINLPQNSRCRPDRNSPLEGTFKYSFSQFLQNLASDSKILDQINKHIELTGQYSVIDLSRFCLWKLERTEFHELMENEINRILIALVFWEYVTDCINYDLNLRKYPYANYGQ